MEYAPGSQIGLLDFIDEDKLLELQTTVSKATGMALAAVDHNGDMVTEPISYNEFCGQMRRNPDSARICRSSDGFGASQARVNNGKVLYFCPCGLLKVVAPITFKGKFLGGLLGGQVKCDNAPEETGRLENVIREGREFVHKNKRLRQLFDQIPSYDFNIFSHFTNLISMIVRQLDDTAHPPQVVLKPWLGGLPTRSAKDKNIGPGPERSILTAMKYRLNRYFLINALSSISNLAFLENAAGAVEMAGLLADYLRSINLDDENHFIDLDDEMKNIGRYLTMQKIRFGDRLIFDLDLPEEMRAQKAPAHVIMPFVERAVFYGLAVNEGGLEISISCRYHRGQVRIRVADDGSGLQDADLSKLSVVYRSGHEGQSIDLAVAEARRRLAVMFGVGCDPAIRVRPGRGTECLIDFPRRPDVVWG